MAVTRVGDILAEDTQAGDILVEAAIPAGECPAEAVIPEEVQEAAAAVAVTRGQEARARAPAFRLSQPI